MTDTESMIQQIELENRIKQNDIAIRMKNMETLADIQSAIDNPETVILKKNLEGSVAYSFFTEKRRHVYIVEDIFGFISVFYENAFFGKNMRVKCCDDFEENWLSICKKRVAAQEKANALFRKQASARTRALVGIGYTR